MKTKCEQIRKLLPKYLLGHLFKIRQNSIERHLKQCVVCRSEFEALRHAEETRQILKEINAPEGVVSRMKERVSSLGKLKKIFYRPLWIIGFSIIAAGIYYYIVTPKQLDLEIDRIVKTTPTVSSSQPSAPLGDTTDMLAPSVAAGKPLANPASASDPLVITITPNDDTSAVEQINEIIREHASLRKATFTDTQKEITGSLIRKDMLTLFERIESEAKVRYSNKRFNSFPAARPIPFVMKLKTAPKPAEKPAPSVVLPTQQSTEHMTAPASESAPSLSTIQ